MQIKLQHSKAFERVPKRSEWGFHPGSTTVEPSPKAPTNNRALKQQRLSHQQAASNILQKQDKRNREKTFRSECPCAQAKIMDADGKLTARSHPDGLHTRRPSGKGRPMEIPARSMLEALSDNQLTRQPSMRQEVGFEDATILMEAQDPGHLKVVPRAILFIDPCLMGVPRPYHRPTEKISPEGAALNR